MPYTIINSATGGQFISQSFDTEDEAKARLEALKAKFGDRVALAVANLEGESQGGEVKAPKKVAEAPEKPRPMPRR